MKEPYMYQVATYNEVLESFGIDKGRLEINFIVGSPATL